MASRNSFLGHFTRTTFYFVLALAMVMTESSGRRRRLLLFGAGTNSVPVSVITIYAFLTEIRKKVSMRVTFSATESEMSSWNVQ